jgi:hypothetical protein
VVSIEAINWALTTAAIPSGRRDTSSLAVVLVGLANHADPDGRNAFPSLGTLMRYTRLSERSVRYALRTLQELDLIRPSDPEIVAAYVKRADRRPNGYDLVITSARPPVDNSVDEGRSVPPGLVHEGQARRTRGATSAAAGGRACPRNVLNHPRNRPAAGPRVARPPCGQCDARPTDPVSARLVWLDGERTRSSRCPRCHPRAAERAGGQR